MEAKSVKSSGGGACCKVKRCSEAGFSPTAPTRMGIRNGKGCGLTAAVGRGKPLSKPAATPAIFMVTWEQFQS